MYVRFLLIFFKVLVVEKGFRTGKDYILTIYMKNE